jgi:hypothetical protein
MAAINAGGTPAGSPANTITITTTGPLRTRSCRNSGESLRATRSTGCRSWIQWRSAQFIVSAHGDRPPGAP